ncbi:MAG: dihydrodipicolinate synthase family protein [Armatimonadota bacterium]|nr:dihydrodipicolinate synthase family protein [Armatimonadota bacterium]MDR7452663.1 dihydrodipicolinate synthase family protein [Armatimonadota bacterium]MDR7467739.1 dihydrodipicolinate synthase family protein [Armatimonadota bacterium]MDR7494939.1 dihydrodipicolinate synthase family protein [Armatimonadota bacterium]MDR7499796.1 dihydrodipicolinate synthase family protein [Armatimonadota bacterium]
MFDRRRLGGIVVPMVTPFEDDGITVREQGVRRLVDFLIETGVHGIFVAGTTGEAAALDDAQWRRLVQAASGAGRGRVPLLAGVIAPTTALAAARARWAADLGADVVVAAAPYYYLPDRCELVAHFREIVRATPLPVLLYNIPQTTKVHLTLEVYLALADEEQIVGLKDSAGDVTEFRKAVRALRAGGRDFRMFLGTDHLTDVAALVGAQGTVPSLGNIAGRDLVAAWQAAAAGDWTESARRQERVAALTRVYDLGREVHQTGIIVGLKCALTLMGIPAGPPAPPALPASAEEVRRVEAVLREGGLLP